MNKFPLPWKTLRDWLWPFAFGLVMAGALLSWLGLGGVSWIWAGASVVALLAIVAGNKVWRQHTIAVDAPADANLLPALAREVFEQLPDPLLLLEGTDRVVFANAAMRRVIGTDYERKHLSVLLRVPGILEAVDMVAPGEEPATVEFSTRVPIERHFEAYVSRSTVAPLTLLLLHDLTSIKRSEQMRADFVANASHELRTPLAAVSGFIDTLQGPCQG